MTNTKIFSLMVFSAAVASLATYWYLNATTVAPPETDPKTTICADYNSENMSTLDVDLVHTMVEGYRRNQWDFINTNPSSQTTNDANSIWFDLETLKKFLYHIENISRKTAGIAGNKLGVRIYYAAYPNLEQNPNKFEDIDAMRQDTDTQKYGYLHTLVMIPTIEGSKGEILDFNPLDKNTYETGILNLEDYKYNSPAPIPNSNPNPQLNSIGALSGSARHTGSRNHGVLSPPGLTSGYGF